MAVHYAVHLKKGNPHLHIAATPRAIDVKTQTFSEKKIRLSRDVLQEMRQKVAEIGNVFALAHGYNFRWDHRSYKDQGIEIVPTHKRGWAAEKLEKMGGVSRILSENQEIHQKNIELLLEKPKDLIRLVARRKAVFTRQDLEEEILKRVGGDAVLFGVLRDKVAGVKIAPSAVISKTVNSNWSRGRKASDSPVYDSPEALRSVSSWTAQVLGHEEAVAIGETLRGEKVYTSQSYQQMEQEIEGYVKQLRAEQISPVSREVKKHALKKIEQQKGFSFSKEQKGAVDHLLSSCRLEVLTGQAGTGKTTVLKPVVEAYRQAGYEIIGTSFQGKVADMLSRELGIRGLNIDQLRYRWKEHERYKVALSEGTLRGKALLEARKGLKRYASSRLTSNHVMIVDEGNMVNAPLWQALLKEVTTSGAILRVVEDNRQIKTLFGGDIARLIEEKSGAYTLTQVRRQKVKWMQDASKLLNAHQVEEGLRKYREQERLQFHDNLEGAKWGIVADYLNGIEEDAKASRVILTFRNSEVKEINAAIRERLKDKGLLGREFEMVLKDSESSSGVKTLRLAIGERIFFTVNDATEWHVKTLKDNGSVGQGVRNGTPGIIEDYDEKRKTMKVRLEDGRLVGFDTRSYSSLTYGYAMTINKAEGETYTYSHVLFDPLMNANSLLIAMTRHERDCQVRISRTHAQDLKEMVQATERGSYRGVLSDYRVASEDKRWFDLAQSYARKVIETGVLADRMASQKETQEPTPQAPVSSSGASILHVSNSPESVASSQDDLSPQMEKAVRDRESLAKEVLSGWDDCVPYLLASGFTQSQVEIHAGVRQRLLSEVEQVALQRVEDYRKIACETRKAWLDIKEACPVKVLAFQHEGWSRFEALRERRAELAYEIAGHPALHRPFFKVTASEQEGIPVYTTRSGNVYEDRPTSFKTALKHGDEYISRQKDSAYVSLLSPSEQQSYGEVLRLRNLMRSCAGLYKGWQESQQTGVISQVAESALRRLHEVRRERDLLAYRMMTSGKDYTPFLEKLSIDSVAILKHAASGEVRLLCLKREHVRTVEERVEMSARLLGFVTKRQEQISLTTEQKGWIMVMKEHGITSDHLRFEAGYSHYLREGKTSLYTDIKALKAAWGDMEAYQKTHRESAKRWEILKTWSTAYVQGLQDDQVRALNLLPDTKTFLVRVNMEDKAMARLQEKAVNPRVLAAVTTEIRQVAGGLASFSDLGEEIKVRQGELTHLQSHLRRGRSGYLSLFREQRGETLGYEDLHHKKLEQAWHVIDKSSPIIEGLFNKGHMLEAARLQKEAHEFATWEKVKSLSRLKGEEKAQVCHQLWEQSQQEGLEGKSFVKGALVKERVSFDRLCLYSLAYQHVKAGEMKEQGISLYTLVESYLDAKESFSALWKRRQENIKDQLAEVKETYEQKREDVICVLEEKNVKGSVPYQVDRLIDSLIPDKAGEIRISAREKTAIFVADRHVEPDAEELETLTGDMAQLYRLKVDIHKERLNLLGKPDKEMIEAVSERNQTACHLLDSSLGDKLRASEERVLVSLVEYGQKGALRQSSRP
jgi:nucleoside-triphosphatase THEP1